ncbi:carboxypeptidase regulatory-like domain-containing protein [Telmatobacter sp. DSM 110680]|uniref:Carboxypeptidase regulatory-like domain-containing protein n=1 Tax=Telmatobacter sp. DSM 110680 TaxID=3036704 RepID=A0AAU7DM14_9BACT
MSKPTKNFAALFLVMLWAGTLLGQKVEGSLRGTVLDATDARIPSARIELHAIDGASTRSVLSDDRGLFRVEDLAPGKYRVVVEATGFDNAVANVSIEVSSSRDIAVTMQPSVVREKINVRAASSSIATQPIDLASQIHKSVITSGDLEMLPLSDRSFANIAYLAPGTEPVEPSDPTKARITAVSAGGSSGLNNELSVDGADNSDDYIGGFLQNFSPDSIQEFAVSTAQEDADTGGTTAASVVITTKRGTDNWHGDAAFFERAAALNARFPIENPTPDPKQPFSRQNYVGTLGGPLRRQKLWAFAAFEQVHEDASIAYSPANMAEFDALAALASDGLIPGVASISVPANVPIPFRDSFGSVRLDWTQNPRSSWFLRSSLDTYTTHNNLVQQGTLPSTGLLTHNNYLNATISNDFIFNSTWLGRFIAGGSGLRLTQHRNSDLGFALAFPFSSTSLTVSGFETFGDNQFETPITYFPSQRSQEKYQLRYDVTNARSGHGIRFGINFIHEPVLSGAFPSNNETLYQFPQDPSYYIANAANLNQFATDMQAGASISNLGGGFSQNVQRLALYAEDSWRVTKSLTINYGLRYGATFGLFEASNRSQSANPAYITLQALEIPLVTNIPRDDRKQLAPRFGFAFSPGVNGRTVLRAGIGIYADDLAQGGWATAFQAVHTLPGPCVDPVTNSGGPENAGCVPGSSSGGSGNLIAPSYKTPYAIHITGGLEHSFREGWSLSADYTHEQGNHGYRAYSYTGGTNLSTPLLPSTSAAQADVVPDVNVFHSDNRSSYNALMFHLQGSVAKRLNFVANYTFAKAQTWGCVLGELFDYVNGVCNPLDAFGPGDYGPSGEDVRHRVVLAGTWHAPKGIAISTLTQLESARPFTITTSDNAGRIQINGIPTSLDQFRGTPYIQSDLRVGRPIKIGDHQTIAPFVEFFNLFNRNNPGANYVTNIAALPVPAAEAQAGNITHVCANADCTAVDPIASPSQLRVAGGALGDFFGPGTTVGTPFAAQVGVRWDF